MEARPEGQLRCFLFGALSLFKGEQPLALPYTENARSLFAYLLLNDPNPQQRSLLTGIFWPEKPDAWGRSRLAQAIYQLRSWAPGLVIADAHRVALNPEFSYWADVVEFRRRIVSAPDAQQEEAAGQSIRQQRIQALQQAVQLYRGDLMEGFYADWVLAEREALHESYLRALSELVELEKAGGKYSEALAYALRLAQAEPLQEAYHREVMRLHFILQQPEAALKQYALCCQVLKDELAEQPEAETAALAQEIAARSGAAQAAAPFLPRGSVTQKTIAGSAETGHLLTGQLPLIGRESEHARLTAILDETLDGFGGIVLLEGEAGVGKTRLAQELAVEAEWRTAQVLWGYGREGEDSQPYEPLVQALSNGLTPLRIEELTQFVQPVWLSVLTPLLPELAGGGTPLEKATPLPAAQERERLHFAFAQLLAAWAEIRPLALALEDVQWMDEDTLELLCGLGETAAQGSLLILCTYRKDEAHSRPAAWERIQAIRRQSACRYICLERLNASDSAELIRRALRLKTAAQLFEARLYQETGGNPLFILETLRVLHDEGLLYQDVDGNWNTAWDEATQDYRELPLSPLIEQSIARRLRQLPANARLMLELAAVAGRQCEMRLLRAASEADPRVLVTMLGVLAQRGMLEETPACYQFSHERLRQVVYQEISATERRRLHRKFAQALQDHAPQRLAALAYHYTRGEAWSEAVKYHQSAGKQAQAVFASRLAWDHATQALEILQCHAPFQAQEGAEIAFDLLFARSNLAWMKGDIARQEADILALVEQAQMLSDPQRKTEAYIQQAGFLCNAKDEYEKAHQAAATALALAEEHGLTRLAAGAWQQIGLACQRSDQYPQAEQALQKAVELWQSMPEEGISLAEALIHLAQVYERTGDVAQTKAQAQKAVDLAQQNQALLTLARAWVLLGALAYRENDYGAAIQFNQGALQKAQQIGHKHNEAVVLCNLGFDYWALGDYAKTIDFTRQGFEIYRQLGNRRGMVLCCDNLSALYNETGQYLQAQTYIVEGLEAAQQIGFLYEEGLLLANLGRMHLEQNDLQNARQAYQQALEIAQGIDAPYVRAGACLGLGMTWYAQEAYAQAGEQFALAFENYQQAGESAFASGARAYLALSKLSTGDLCSALDLSGQAVTELEAAGGGEYVQDIYLHHFLILTAAGQAEASYQALEKAYQAVQARAATLPSEWRGNYLNQVAVNRRIMQAWAGMRPEVVQIRLPRVEAPSGRPLREDEWIEVSWTVSAAADLEIADKQERRRARLLRLLAEAGAQGAAPTIADLARAIGAGAATVKRDLACLRRAGHQLATRGERASQGEKNADR